MSITYERQKLQRNRSKTGHLLKKLHIEEKKYSKLTKPIKQPKDALYLLVMVSLVIALLYGIAASAITMPATDLIVSRGNPGTSEEVLDEGVCDLNVVDCNKRASVSEGEVVEQIKQIAEEEDFPWVDYAIRLTWCESRHDPLAINDKNNRPAGSVDRGLWQINSYWQKGVSDDCAFDVECSTRWAMEKIKNGGQTLWACDKLVKL